ncbi:P-3 complex subunit mu [Achlya hypogyna]|uniref:p-3 complex subunit mu n=1 Tax=Achlya hypogyna TaxID=1202772 RepID=A0A1V9YFV6_ACHHY|nr:P-3 complex subunit mu [Achlya hypogyna]
MYAPPSTVNRIAAIVSGKSRVSDVLPDGAVSDMPWRKAGVKYTQNEIYFDIVEEIDAIVDERGQMVSCEVNGAIHGNCRLSGIPDLTMVFTDPSVIDDCSFHLCVRYSRYTASLMQYRVQVQQLMPPIYCQPSVSYTDRGVGSLELMIGQHHMPTLVANSVKKAYNAEDITVEMTFPKSVRTVDANTDVGSCLFDDSTKVNPKKILTPTLKGHIVLQQGAAIPDEKPIVLLGFKVPMTTVSGLTVETLVLSNERYKPYKGVRTLTKAGRFQIRT